jgi:TonB family protein
MARTQRRLQRAIMRVLILTTSVALVLMSVVIPTAAQTREKAAKIAGYTPEPKYPPLARARRIEGKGLFILRVQLDTGLVKDVQVERSTGSSILDSSATGALKEWRFKPDALRRLTERSPSMTKFIRGGILAIRVPVSFVLSGTQIGIPPPRYP